MANDGLSSPILLKYLSAYEKNPKSRVFAPLAESYRKIGMLDKALEILKKGIKEHPTYVMGHLGLAFCYVDQKQYHLAHTILKPLAPLNRDNLRLQRLYAEVCAELGLVDEALETFKYLLFINPRDKELQDAVRRLERGDSASPIKKSARDPFEEELAASPTFNIDKIVAVPTLSDSSVDEWSRLDLTKKKSFIEEEENDDSDKTVDTESFLGWSRQELTAGDRKADILDTEQTKIPLITHTLVDLYLAQGHHEKAIEVLEKILELNPSDDRTKQKIKEVQFLLEKQKKVLFDEESESQDRDEDYRPFFEKEEQDFSEAEGHKKLQGLIDKKLKKRSAVPPAALEAKLKAFHNALQKKAQEKL